MTTLLQNPLRAGLRIDRLPKPVIMVIFGASGDLAQRKLLPALYDLARERNLPSEFTVVGVGRSPMSDDQFRDRMHEGVQGHSRDFVPQVWEDFARGLFYFAGDLNQPEFYGELRTYLEELDTKRGTQGNRVYYLSIPPSSFPVLLESMVTQGMAGTPETVRIIVEKPFGRDLKTGQELNAIVSRVFHEDQIYRIDHYLGKETVQNILVFRFANAIFEPLWDRRYLDHVQITVAETVGLEGRGKYYEEAGALRDMLQNHLMQVLTLVCMEPPAAIEANTVRDEKVKVLRSMVVMDAKDVALNTVRAQYSRGFLGGKAVPGYREEGGVNLESITPTYAAVKLHIDNWRWSGVPIYLRTGKRLAKRASEVSLHFRESPSHLFRRYSTHPTTDVLALRIQPDEGISIRFDAKVPGPDITMRPVNMDFRYGTTFAKKSPEAYERLLLDCLYKDQTLFARADEVEYAWKVVTPIIEQWTQGTPADLASYEAGTWGPKAADQLLNRDNRHWRRL
ncbi:glucose-6-phosphate dehydrogenase [Candidatus Cyanaurora vandensis]|uniref:glucose-6-phosphate dehydrogenase n=1 Tax=Candidatus Cyanaurora vandensis TaxID=2714958 RepID=UPI002579C9E0|nr:glucose-6-phosphate dehydrogenase [Candidatus Cyanaurora vandensis]